MIFLILNISLQKVCLINTYIIHLPFIISSCEGDHRLCQLLQWEYVHDILEFKHIITSLINTYIIQLPFIISSFEGNHRFCKFLKWEYVHDFLDIKHIITKC